MPQLRLQIKSAYVDDVPTFSEGEQEPLTFRTARPTAMLIPKPVFRRQAPFPRLPGQRDLNNDLAEGSVESRSESGSTPQPSAGNSSTSSSARRGILRSAIKRHGNTSTARRRVHFQTDLGARDRFTNAPSTPRHPSLVSASPEPVRVKLEDEDGLGTCLGAPAGRNEAGGVDSLGHGSRTEANSLFFAQDEPAWQHEEAATSLGRRTKGRRRKVGVWRPGMSRGLFAKLLEMPLSAAGESAAQRRRPVIRAVRESKLRRKATRTLREAKRACPPTSVPSIVVAPATEALSSDPAKPPPEALPVRQLSLSYSATNVRDFLICASAMLGSSRHMLHFPPLQLLSGLRALAHDLLQRSQPIRDAEHQIPAHERSTIRRLRDLLKHILVATQITKLLPAKVNLKMWEQSRCISLDKVDAIKRLLDRALLPQPACSPSVKSEKLKVPNASTQHLLVPARTR
ncbi:uncharacterized protein PAN0_001d0877 [Moesziomyces antarcticus]|uniref:Uncharacterized protein n=1 Tax=Pseudozyma antarctica TaxID=84753 RepID=A0A5C3FFX0_PSEA2|nr:uncharacterized protein PAN0_001d0877 [Moesziomyces antarcticus]GAK62676.1 hypothetical protein PAN0_001d0877 [Moesziomyces antarcticus]SPO43238.1 uncharacterized protein PSANT_00922 [Moesziomyces antarcticus]